MLKRHEVEILLKAGHPQTEVARLAGVSLCSVKRIAEEAPVAHVDDAAEREKRRIGRPSTVENFRKFIVEILEEKPDLPSLEILRRVREVGYRGGKTALYAMVASLRPKGIKPLVRFEGLPGEFSKHDVRFETAVLVFDDPYAITQRDVTFEDEERWITVGAIGPGSILLVVHTFYEELDEEVIRVVPARAAESHERRAYEEGHKGAEAGHPSDRRKKRRRH